MRRSLEDYLPNDYRIVGIDLLDESEVSMSHPGFTYIQQAASDLSRFGEKEFDLAFSIGMMEHICNCQFILGMARQIDRVSREARNRFSAEYWADWLIVQCGRLSQQVQRTMFSAII